MIPHITPRAAAQAFAIFGDPRHEERPPMTEAEIQEAIRKAKEEAWEEGKAAGLNGGWDNPYEVTE